MSKTANVIDQLWFSNPIGIVSSGQYVYVSNSSPSNSVTIINAATQTLVTNISNYTNPDYSFNYPHGMCYDGSHVWITTLGGLEITNPDNFGSRVTGINADGAGDLYSIWHSYNPNLYGPQAFDNPYDICYDANNNCYWISNMGHTYSRQNILGGITQSRPVPGVDNSFSFTLFQDVSYTYNPMGIATDGSHVFFANLDDNTTPALPTSYYGLKEFFTDTTDFSNIFVNVKDSYDVTSSGNYVWMNYNSYNSGSGVGTATFYKFNSTTHTYLTAISYSSSKTFNNPTFMASDNTYVWAANHANQILRFPVNATNSSQIISENPNSVFSSTKSVCLDSNYVWVVDQGSNQIVALTNPGAAFVNTVYGNLGSAGFANGIYADDVQVWFTQSNIPGTSNPGIINYDIGSGTFTPYATALQPFSLASDGTTVWATYPANGGGIAMIDSTGTLSQIVTVSNSTAANYTFVNAKGICCDNTYLWVTDIGTNSVVKINKSDMTLVTVYTNTTTASTTGVASFTNPSAIVSCNNTDVWVANTNAYITRFNWATGAFLAQVQIPTTAGTISAYPYMVTDNHTVCVIYQGTNLFYQFVTNQGTTTSPQIYANNDSTILYMGVAVRNNYIWLQTSVGGIGYIFNPILNDVFTYTLQPFINFNYGNFFSYPTVQVGNTIGTKPGGAITLDAMGNLWSIGFNGLLQVTNAAPCFNKGTKILCIQEDTNEEQYIPIEELEEGSLIKTYLHGNHRVYKICSGQYYNNTSWNEAMYVMKKNDENGLVDDLIVTGGHSLLVDELTTDQLLEYKIRKVWKHGTPLKIDDKYLLLAAMDDRFQRIEDKELYTYYHIVLENDDDDDQRYGIWANGLLTETISVNQYKEYLRFKTPF